MNPNTVPENESVVWKEHTPSTDSSLAPGCRPTLPQRLVSRFSFANPINLVLRMVVGCVFVYAGAIKIVDPAKFAIAVGNYRAVPYELTNLVAIIVPWIELIAGALVIAGVRLWAASTVIAGLTLIFLLLISSALMRGLSIECGCFGTVGGRHAGLLSLAIDAILFSLAALLVKRSAHLTGYPIFNEAGSQNSASPLKASPKASPAAKRVLSSVVCSDTRG